MHFSCYFQAEKDSGLRALRDCQESLDVTKKSLADTTEEVRAMKVDQGAQEAKFQALSTQNQALTSQLSEILNEKSELRSTCAALEGEIGQLKEEKVINEIFNVKIGTLSENSVDIW